MMLTLAANHARVDLGKMLYRYITGEVEPVTCFILFTYVSHGDRARTASNTSTSGSHENIQGDH